jgi:hypothetical protein
MSAMKMSSSHRLPRPSKRQVALASAALAGGAAAVVPAHPAGAHQEVAASVVDPFGGTRGVVGADHYWVGVCHQGSGAGHINYRMLNGGSGILEAFGENCEGRNTSSRVTRFQVCDLRIGRCTGWKSSPH